MGRSERGLLQHHIPNKKTEMCVHVCASRTAEAEPMNHVVHAADGTEVETGMDGKMHAQVHTRTEHITNIL